MQAEKMARQNHDEDHVRKMHPFTDIKPATDEKNVVFY